MTRLDAQRALPQMISMRCLASLAAVFALSVSAYPASAAEPSRPAAAPPASPVLLRLEPRTRSFIEGLGMSRATPLYTMPIPLARAFLTALQEEYAPSAVIPADVADHVIPVGPTGSVPIRIFRPQGSAEPLPVVVYFHGGGWILGDERTHDRLVRELAVLARAAVVFVKYTPSPEARFPVPLQQAYAATRYIAENGASLGLDGSRLALAGDSVGGNMAAVVALLAREHGRPEIRHQALFYPVTDANLDTASYRQFAEGPWLTRRTMQWFWNAYAPDPADRATRYVAPLRASLAELRGLPPALVITDENDVLRDEGEAYAHRLMQAEVSVTAVRVLGTIHDFMMLNALADTPATRSAIALAGEELRRALTR